MLAGVAGIFSVGTVMTVDVSQTGYQMELDAILAVVIGGTSLAGGKFSLGGAVDRRAAHRDARQDRLFLGVPASATPAFKAIVIIVLCLLQSERVRSWFVRRRPQRRDRRPTPTDRADEGEGDGMTDRRDRRSRQTLGSPTGTTRVADAIGRLRRANPSALPTVAAIADLRRHGDLR